MSAPEDSAPAIARDMRVVSLEARMKSAYLDYAMSVIVGRALPDARDGLKPVHRRTLHAMREIANDWNKPYKKSARIVGDVLGKYHPHSGDAVYDALVRMAQSFSLRCPLVDGQGNFGSIDGDNAAAMRYTEVRMAKIAHALLEDIDRDTVDFVPNYDGADKEPVVLPARFPNLLINGSTGIAVGMATSIPPHNPGECIDACLHLLRRPKATWRDLAKIVRAPDFPTGGIICGVAGAHLAYKGDRGRVIVRARVKFEDIDKKGAPRQAIIVEELPYQVNKAALIARIAEMARDKKIEGIADLRDESDRHGVRVVIELKRGENAEVALNRLYKETQLQDSFSMNFVALVDGAPRTMNLLEIIEEFLRHRREVVVRRTLFLLNRARERAHLLEGLATAVENVDEVVALIRNSQTPAAAKESLLARDWSARVVAAMLAKLEDPALARPEGLEAGYGLRADAKKPAYRFSPTQAQAILDMRLARLTALEREKIAADYAAVVAEILDYLETLARPEKVTEIIADELKAVKKQFAEPRRSEIGDEAEDIDIENLIAEEDMVVTLSHRGYVKRQPLSDYRAQNRGGRGKQAASMREDDFVDKLFVANTHDYLLVFTNRGRLYWIKVYQLPQATRAGRGKPVVNLLNLMEHERAQAILPVKQSEMKSEGRFVVMATAAGVVKKTTLLEYSNPRPSGIIAIRIDENDSLINAALTDGAHKVMLFSNVGKAARFAESNLRPLGRIARGVRGMRLKEGQKIVSMLTGESDEWLVLTATEKGYGKRTRASEYAVKGRGGQGVLTLNVGAKTGEVVGAAWATGVDDELMLISNHGVLIRTRMKDIRKTGRSAQGVRLINLDANDTLVGVARIEEPDEPDEESGGDDGAGGDSEAG